ncbi:MAG: ADP-ribosylglycohydrolase family protein [Oscillospiraceae bacterium]|nr:ADP-ribosylglycohydrolase family protein [Oscillospiraceae bacterium]
MDGNMSAYRGCLLGLAAGDAMGYTVDNKTLEEIRENYGPDGLLGYDLQETEFATITSYTQIAAYLSNALLLSVSRGKGDYSRYVKLGLREFTRSQQFYRDPEASYCWVAKCPQFRRRHCRDARMLDILRLEFYGSPENPRNDNNAPGALTAGIAVGLFYNSRRLTPEQVGSLTAQTVALTHGNPEAFLCAVVLAYAIAGIVQEPEYALRAQFEQAIAAMDGQFRARFPVAEELARQLRGTIALAESDTASAEEGMEQLRCMDAAGVLAGAIFACLRSPDDFDRAMITAVNHSGLSAAVGAVAGAILGARLGEEALPEFYLESLECASALRILGEDMVCATPTLGLFDDAWDHKYVQGMPPEGVI